MQESHSFRKWPSYIYEVVELFATCAAHFSTREFSHALQCKLPFLSPRRPLFSSLISLLCADSSGTLSKKVYPPAACNYTPIGISPLFLFLFYKALHRMSPHNVQTPAPFLVLGWVMLGAPQCCAPVHTGTSSTSKHFDCCIPVLDSGAPHMKCMGKRTTPRPNTCSKAPMCDFVGASFVCTKARVSCVDRQSRAICGPSQMKYPLNWHIELEALSLVMAATFSLRLVAPVALATCERLITGALVFEPPIGLLDG